MKCEGETCKGYWTCRYLQNRFGTKEKKCGYDEDKVEIIHNLELKARRKMLKSEANK